jgi:hypothetical protein
MRELQKPAKNGIVFRNKDCFGSPTARLGFRNKNPVFLSDGDCDSPVSGLGAEASRYRTPQKLSSSLRVRSVELGKLQFQTNALVQAAYGGLDNPQVTREDGFLDPMPDSQGPVAP